MSKEEIFNKIAEILADRFELKTEQITNTLNFKEDLNADSIDIVEFVLELEDTFGAEITDEAAENLVTVGDAVDYISEHQA
ncbi:acyl carrier protein [Pediococcus pentosaceus]|uniref:Acyl carrier protein n=2 Tax=Pediococcus pentosaceus TaxID=1255 RepID=A0A0Q1DNV7_PEDPE|nr:MULTISPECIES: acyl carrier protein [Pediococcus]ABJ67901.1 Acyl carrier protein [Pediococcus pentosaceus ATCC 25745]AHA04968.1 acyl carrier protein [Pediococcus pentosaceus SL4]ANI98002.1 acyl carrier protein [Pediococcus pentosaceus]ASC08603.1 Acyl carrier protein [Pediococcus pentosaceus]AVL01405.1 acyl carrier protein [Pediococcus pentosaceus]